LVVSSLYSKFYTKTRIIRTNPGKRIKRSAGISEHNSRILVKNKMGAAGVYCSCSKSHHRSHTLYRSHVWLPAIKSGGSAAIRHQSYCERSSVCRDDRYIDFVPVLNTDCPPQRALLPLRPQLERTRLLSVL
jgi:hypothetical protein